MKELFDRIFERNRLNRRLHWTTIASEKILLAIIGLLAVIASAQYIWGMFQVGEINLADLFLLFIYVEIIGMIGAFPKIPAATRPRSADALPVAPLSCLISLVFAIIDPYSAASSTAPRLVALAVYWSMRFSISGRKLRIRPCTGQAAASPKAQMV